MSRWTKKGLIFIPNKSLVWSQSHAQVPVVDFLEQENILKIYYSTRDKNNQTLPGFIILDADNLSNILEISKDPILSLGDLGAFDDSGVMPSWIVNYNNKKYLYYIGWNVGNKIAYHNSVGLAISEDNGKSFQKFSQGPLWDRNYIEPYFSGTTCVIIDDGVWKNWYLSCTGWKVVNGKSEPRYHIKYAESKDGIEWNRKGSIAIDFKNDNEAGIVKSSVIKEDGIYKMWYSYRNYTNYRTDKKNSYKIGYAESNNGITWDRLDNSDLCMDTSENEADWDGTMVEYPHVVDVKGKRLMFYNGNGFGESGFGYAELQSN
jgi:hypothetical protein